MKKLLSTSGLVLGLSILAAAPAHALIANDVASNPAYSGGWLDNTNGGTGFLAWSITNNDGSGNFAGTFTGSSTDGAGNINTSGVSFGLYAHPVGAFVNADRAFATSLSVLDTFTFQLALNYDNGSKGFNIFAGTQGEVLNFNVGSGGSVGSANATLNSGSGAGYDYGGNDAVIDVTIAMTSASSFSYNISRTSSQGFQGTLFSGTVSGLTDNVTGFRFYNSGTDDGSAQNNLYVNNLSVVPEPSSLALLGLGLTALGLRRKAKVS